MKVTSRFPESIIEPREGQELWAVTAAGGEYDRVSNPTALKTVSNWVGCTPSEFTIKSVTTAQTTVVGACSAAWRYYGLVPSLVFESIQDLTVICACN